MDDDPLITITDIRLAGHCPSGARTWFRDHNLDFVAFLQNGLPASALLAVEDNALAQQVVERKKARENG